jgi:hypothetical protein
VPSVANRCTVRADVGAAKLPDSDSEVRRYALHKSRTETDTIFVSQAAPDQERSRSGQLLWWAMAMYRGTARCYR